MSYQCTQCLRGFPSPVSLNAHCTAKRHHHYCQDCSRQCVDAATAVKHKRYHAWRETQAADVEEIGTMECEPSKCLTCNIEYASQKLLDMHYLDNYHHNWCFICGRDFKSEGALNMHNSSPVHREASHKCPFCDEKHKVPSATALHIESGCHDINRHQVTTAVHAMGIVPNISIAHRLEASTQQPPEIILAVTADEQSFDGEAWICYVCNDKFATLERLNRHLNSPAHDPNEFKCPKCNRQYKLISGLIQHIESQACGVAKMKQVDDFAEGIASQFARLVAL